MLQRPGIELIKGLHQTGRQLAVLKRMYQSYALIIKRILEKQQPSKELTARQSRDGAMVSGTSDHVRILDSQGIDHPTNPEGSISRASETYGALLSQAAVFRFERLLDRINHYALSEIQECLDEKDALVFMVSESYFRPTSNF